MTFAYGVLSGKLGEVQVTGENTGNAMMELEGGHSIMLELYGKQVESAKLLQDNTAQVAGSLYLEGSMVVVTKIKSIVPAQAHFNFVTVCGYAGRDAEAKTVKSGLDIANTSVAVNHYGKDKPSWFNLTFFRKKANIAQRFVTKGTMLNVAGSLKLDSYKNKEGKEVKRININCEELNLMPKAMSRGGYSDGSSIQTVKESPSQAPASSTDEIPF